MKVNINSAEYEIMRIFCIGMNFSDHIKELNSKTPSKPVIFMKPSSSLVPLGRDLNFPLHGNELHYETELVFLIGKEGHVSDKSQALDFISGISLGFDLTLRDLQSRLKKDGHPWEISKAFDDSCTVGEFTPYEPSIDLQSIEFSGLINGEIRQIGHSSEMIFPVTELISCIGSIWKFLPGDLIFTGTPPGVGPLSRNDTFSAQGNIFKNKFEWKFKI